MNGKKIALFGGTFDPVHSGHVNAVSSVLAAMPDIDRVIVMPAYVNPFKTDMDTEGRASGEQRIEMCRIAFEGLPKCTVSDFEIKRGGVSYTIVTLEHLHKTYPEAELVLITGSDSLESLPRWYRFEDIARLAEIAAVSRRGSDSRLMEDSARAAKALGARVRIIPAEPFEISSTEIREKILNNRDLSCYMDKNVVKYILTNKIYRKNG